MCAMTSRSGRFGNGDWRKSTPDAVGPGAYGASTTESLTDRSKETARKSKAAFGVSQGRGSLYAEAECPRGPPVGFYEVWAPPISGAAKPCSGSAFRSKSQRSEAHAKVDPWGAPQKRNTTPGPGAYDTPRVLGPCPGEFSPSAKTVQVLKGEKQRQKVVAVVGAAARASSSSRAGCTPRATVPSIPGRGNHGYECREDGRLIARKPRKRREVEADVDPEIVRTRTRGGVICPPKEDPVVDRSVSETPGPGTYESSSFDPRMYRASSAFASYSPQHNGSPVDTTPGPGHYNDIFRRKSLEHMEPFGSSTARFGKRVGGSELGQSSPGPGYLAHQDLGFARQRTRKGSSIPGFGTTPRDEAKKEKDVSPGPASYDAKGHAYDSGRALASVFEATSKGSDFGKCSPRTSVDRSQTPGPGTYDGHHKSPRPKSMSPSAAFQVTPRQDPGAHIQDTPAGADYEPHGPSSIRRADKTGEGFLSVSPRFTGSSAMSPGPGAYEPFTLGTGVSAPFGIRTDSALGQTYGSPGPGSYETPDKWHSKTFNVLYGEVA